MNHVISNGGPGSYGGVCVDSGAGAHGSEDACKTSDRWANYEAHHGDGSTGIVTPLDKRKVSETENPYVRITSSNSNSAIAIKQLGANNIYGPFTVNYSYSGNCQIKTVGFDVKDGYGRTITGYATCDANGKPITVSAYSPGATFYISIPAYKCTNGVSRVIFNVRATGTYRKIENLYGFIIYRPIPDDGCQRVQSNARVYVGKATTEETRSSYDEISWTNINGGLKITKQDSKTAKKLPGVTLSISGIGSRTTNSNGEIYIENITSKTYTITETATPYYGYRPEEKATATVNGTIVPVTMNNIKHVGDLRITKRDNDNSNVVLPNVTFKIRNSSGQYIIAVDTGRNNKNNCNRKHNFRKPKIHHKYQPSNHIYNKQ